MVHELKPPESHRARALFASVDFHASCDAVLNGMNPGKVLVDDPLDPTAGFVLSPEAAYLGGDADNADFCTGLGAYLRDSKRLGVAVWHLEFVVASESWTGRLYEMAGPNEVIVTPRRHYLCSRADSLRLLPPPEGAAARPIDEDLLNSEAFPIPDHISVWIRNNWGDPSYFLSAGFGMVAVCGTEIVSWSLADCIAGDICEIGIHTAAQWRRRGMGSFTASRAVQYAFSAGLRCVGWHCPEANLASRHTAEKAGFALERQYNTYRIREPGSGADGDRPGPQP